MTLQQTKEFMVAVLKKWLSNKNTLDKISEDKDGDFLFDGKKISSSISKQDGNQLELKTDGVYYSLPLSSTTELGGVKVDGVTITIDADGVISGSDTYELPTASDTVLGGVKVDNTTITIDANGVISGSSSDVENLSDIKDVDITDISDGQILKYNATSSKWENTDESEVKISEETDNAVIQKNDGIFVQTPTNKTTLDKFSTSDDGLLLFDDKIIVGDSVINFSSDPVGTIISYMGFSVPSGYLACDGAIYDIATYNELAEFIKTQFGSYDKFGGNGTTTFAVPDLRGEFLRGTGTNSHANQGNGGDVGEHQDATEHYFFYGTNEHNNIFYPYASNGTSEPIKEDTIVDNLKDDRFWVVDNAARLTTGWDIPDHYTSRPTNTSVLYCIKYTSDINVVTDNVRITAAPSYENYSEDEVVIGKFIDGKPVYRKVIVTTSAASSYKKIAEVDSSVEIITRIDGYIIYHNNTHCPLNSSYANTTRTFTISEGNIICQEVNIIQWQNKPCVLILEYTKTTDAPDSFTPEMIGSDVLIDTVKDSDVADIISVLD